jgi:hypothetical protein
VITLSAKSAGESVIATTGLSVLDPNMQAAPAVGGNMLIKIIGNEAPDDKNSPVGKPDQEKQYTDSQQTADPQDKSTPSIATKAENSPASPATPR